MVGYPTPSSLGRCRAPWLWMTDVVKRQTSESVARGRWLATCLNKFSLAALHRQEAAFTSNGLQSPAGLRWVHSHMTILVTGPLSSGPGFLVILPGFSWLGPCATLHCTLNPVPVTFTTSCVKHPLFSLFHQGMVLTRRQTSESVGLGRWPVFYHILFGSMQ